MNFLPEELNAYAEAHTTPESDVLKDLNRETYLKVLMPQMLSGHLQGAVLTMTSKMIHPERILEIGTYTGYSTICLAAGLTETGIIHTIDINEELKEMTSRYFNRSGFSEKIKMHTGNALEIIPSLNEMFDIVFIDADKINYSNYYDLVFDKVSDGGFIIADNVLWSGKVIEKNQDADTKAIVAFNKKIAQDPRVTNVLLPIRDGLMVMRKEKG